MSDDYLRSGIFLAPFHNDDENPTLSMERDLELLEHLDRLNYHEAWIGEHHSGGFELIACPEMFIAAAAQRTRHIRLGTGVVSLPYHNPFMLADRMVQLDHMTRGRAMFGVGPGALVHDALKIGIDPSEQRRMMEESFDVVVRLLRGELVSKKTDWFNITDAQLQLRPYTQPTMELAVAAARSPSGSVLAGRYGVGMLSIGGTAPAQMERHTANWGLYEETARTNGYTPNRKDSRVGGFGVLCELAQNWADWEQTKRHYELMARFVHPHFQHSRDLLRGSYDYAVGHRADFVGRASAAIQKAIDDHAARQGKREAAE